MSRRIPTLLLVLALMSALTIRISIEIIEAGKETNKDGLRDVVAQAMLNSMIHNPSPEHACGVLALSSCDERQTDADCEPVQWYVKECARVDQDCYNYCFSITL